MRSGKFLLGISRSMVEGSITGQRVSSAILNPLQWLPGTPKNGRFASINPGGQMVFRKAHVARGSSEEENLLTSRCNARCQEWKHTAQPRSRCKYVNVGVESDAPLKVMPTSLLAVTRPGRTCACWYRPPDLRNASKTASQPRRAARKPESGSYTLHDTPSKFI